MNKNKKSDIDPYVIGQLVEGRVNFVKVKKHNVEIPKETPKEKGKRLGKLLREALTRGG